MQRKSLYDYAVIRVLPRVDREEFMNVGVILYCADKNFLKAQCSIDENRLIAFGGTDAASNIRPHLEALCRISSGGSDAGPIGQMSIGERFRWLTAPRSTIVQTSAVHTGFTDDPQATLDGLIAKLVRLSGNE